jgi:putative PIN family toxin of toxin-antitoxin system
VKPRVVLDTSIYISAIIFGGKPEEVFLLAKEKEIELFVSAAIIAEVATKLSDKFRWSNADVTDFIREIGEAATIIKPSRQLAVIEADESDNRILECAVHARAEYIVSGDQQHLLPLKNYNGIEIISPARFLKRIKKP